MATKDGLQDVKFLLVHSIYTPYMKGSKMVKVLSSTCCEVMPRQHLTPC